MSLSISYLNEWKIVTTYLTVIYSVKGGGTGPAGPVLAGPLFHGGSNILEQTENRSIAKNNSIIILDETILK